MWLLFRKQPRTGKDRGSGRRFQLRNPSGRERAAKERDEVREMILRDAYVSILNSI